MHMYVPPLDLRVGARVMYSVVFAGLFQGSLKRIVAIFKGNPILYTCSRKYWRELNLEVGPQIAIAKILADLNLAVR